MGVVFKLIENRKGRRIDGVTFALNQSPTGNEVGIGAFIKKLTIPEGVNTAVGGRRPEMRIRLACQQGAIDKKTRHQGTVRA